MPWRKKKKLPKTLWGKEKILPILSPGKGFKCYATFLFARTDDFEQGLKPVSVFLCSPYNTYHC